LGHYHSGLHSPPPTDYTAITWDGILVPANTPKAIIAKLNDALVKALQTPEMKGKYAAIGQDLAWSTPEEFAAFIAEESARWSKRIRTAGIKPQQSTQALYVQLCGQMCGEGDTRSGAQRDNRSREEFARPASGAGQMRSA
jgi:hypothetical protein